MSASLKAITHDQAADSIISFADEGRLVQNKWHGRGGDGREIACLLGSIHSGINSPGDCPSHLMPEWLARLTVRLFDGVTKQRLSHYGRAYGESIRRWGAIDAEGWARVRAAFVDQVLGGVLRGAEGRLTDPPPSNWAPVKALFARLTDLIKREAHWSEYAALCDEARVLRDRAWTSYRAARDRAAAAVAAVAAAAEAVVVVARRSSFAKSFDILLSCIDAELAA